MPSELPTSLLGLFITVVVGMLSLLTWVVRRALTGASASQERITGVLDQHLGQIGQHMARTNTGLDIIITRLLDASLRLPESSDPEKRA